MLFFGHCDSPDASPATPEEADSTARERSAPEQYLCLVDDPMELTNDELGPLPEPDMFTVNDVFYKRLGLIVSDAQSGEEEEEEEDLRMVDLAVVLQETVVELKRPRREGV